MERSTVFQFSKFMNLFLPAINSHPFPAFPAGAGTRVECPAGALYQQGHHAEVQLPHADAGGTRRSLAGHPARAAAESVAGSRNPWPLGTARNKCH